MSYAYPDKLPGVDSTTVKSTSKQDSAYIELKSNKPRLPIFINESKFKIYNYNSRRLNPPNKWYIARKMLRDIPNSILLAAPEDIFQNNLVLKDVEENRFFENNSIYLSNNYPTYNYYTGSTKGNSFTTFNLAWLAVTIGLKEDISNYISYTPIERGNYSVKIFDLQSNLVKILFEYIDFDGEIIQIWDYSNDNGDQMPKGWYLALIYNDEQLVFSKNIFKPN